MKLLYLEANIRLWEMSATHVGLRTFLRALSFTRFNEEVRTSVIEVSLSLLAFKVRYSNPCTGLNRPSGFQEAEAPRFREH